MSGAGRAWRDALLVGVGGFAGTVVRAAAQFAVDEPGVLPWVWTIVVVNLVGALCLGLFNGWKNEGELARTSLVVGTGFFGSLTTYSTFACDIASFDGVAVGLALGAAQVVAGVMLAGAGLALGRQMRRRVGDVS